MLNGMVPCGMQLGEPIETCLPEVVTNTMAKQSDKRSLH